MCVTVLVITTVEDIPQGDCVARATWWTLARAEEHARQIGTVMHLRRRDTLRGRGGKCGVLQGVLRLYDFPEGACDSIW